MEEVVELELETLCRSFAPISSQITITSIPTLRPDALPAAIGTDFGFEVNGAKFKWTVKADQQKSVHAYRLQVYS